MADHQRFLYDALRMSSNPNLKTEYNNFSRKLRKEFCDAKSNSNNKLIVNSNNVTKTTWDIINRELNKNTNVKYNNIEIYTDDQLITNPQDIANILNSYFIEAPSSLAQTANLNVSCPSIKKTHFKTPEYNFHFSPVTYYDIIKVS